MKKQKISSASRDFLHSLKGSGRAISTLESYAGKLALLEELIGNLNIRQVSDRILAQAIIRLEKGYPQTIPRSGPSMNQIRSVIKTFFSWALSTGRISRNPAIDLRLAKTENRPIPAISEEELARLFNTIKKDISFVARRDEALFAFYAFSGVRRNEALSLRIDDLDFPKNRVWFCKTKTTGGEYKSFPNKLRKILKQYLIQSATRKASLHSPFLFPGRDPSRSLSSREAQMRFDYWKKAAGLRQNLTLHSFRSGFATRLYRATKDPVLVSNAMGHKNLSSIHRYISMKEDSIRSAMEKAFR
ncbi:MAG: tyrosine-type recombinase/integrase [Candidatus Aminicenantes bacterium]|nr:tyrosine-type recombinase/integrase [Candidatus Aminicenantes bacterium]